MNVPCLSSMITLRLLMVTWRRCFPTKILTSVDIDHILSMRESGALIISFMEWVYLQHGSLITVWKSYSLGAPVAHLLSVQCILVRRSSFCVYVTKQIFWWFPPIQHVLLNVSCSVKNWDLTISCLIGLGRYAYVLIQYYHDTSLPMRYVLGCLSIVIRLDLIYCNFCLLFEHWIMRKSWIIH